MCHRQAGSVKVMSCGQSLLALFSICTFPKYILLIVEVGFLIESCPGILMFTLSFIPFGSHRATFLKESGLRRSYLGLRSPLPPPPPELGRRCSGALILLLLLISAAFCPHGGCAAAAAATAGGLFSSDDSSGDSAS